MRSAESTHDWNQVVWGGQAPDVVSRRCIVFELVLERQVELQGFVDGIISGAGTEPSTRLTDDPDSRLRGQNNCDSGWDVA